MISRIYFIAKLNDCLNSQHRLAEIVPIIFAKRKRSAVKTRCCGTVIYVRLDTISRQPKMYRAEWWKSVSFWTQMVGTIVFRPETPMTFDRGQSAFQWLSDKVLRVANYNCFFPFFFMGMELIEICIYIFLKKIFAKFIKKKKKKIVINIINKAGSKSNGQWQPSLITCLHKHGRDFVSFEYL